MSYAYSMEVNQAESTPMTDPYRELCAELAEEVEHLWSIVKARDDHNEPHSLVDRARALLAEPPNWGVPMADYLPDFPRYVRKTPEGFWIGADHQNGPWRPIPAPQPGLPRRTDRPAVPEGREPASVVGDPSDEELWELYQGPGTFSPVEYARAVLARWGRPAAPPAPETGEVAELVRWMCPAEPYWDGNEWQPRWQVTTDQKLAEYWARPDKPTPLFANALPTPEGG